VRTFAPFGEYAFLTTDESDPRNTKSTTTTTQSHATLIFLRGIKANSIKTCLVDHLTDGYLGFLEPQSKVGEAVIF